MAPPSSERGLMLLSLLSMLAACSCSILPSSYDHAIHFHSRRTAQKLTSSFTSDGGFWFANVTVGYGSNLSLLVDTGSTNVVLNPGKYQASKQSVDLNEHFTVTYGTAESNGTGAATINGALYQDSVVLGGVKVENQTVGIADSSESSTAYPHDGIIGFGSQRFAADNATSWFHNLCDERLVDDCRFGLALDNATSGSLVIGSVDDDLLDGNLTTSPLLEEWFTYGDIVVAGQTVEKDAVIELDNGSSAIVGPTTSVTKIFSSLGAAISMDDTADGLIVTASMACSANLAVGFRFPSTNVSATYRGASPQLFNIGLGALLVPSTNASDLNCTISIVGQDVPDLPGLWVLGQTFFQGNYIDHNLADQTIGFAPLKSRSTGSGSNPSTNNSPPGIGTSVTSLGSCLLVMYLVVGLL